MTFVSCEKDEIKLSGTSWTASFSEEGMSYSQTINFTDSKNVSVIMQMGSISQTITGTYVYEHPTISVTIDGETTDLTVVDKTHISMTEDGTTVTYTKK